MYLYLKALHIIFVVTWFAGMFYIVRLFIYNTEANEKSEPEKLLATRLVDESSVTVGQWRAKTAFSYVLRDGVELDPTHLPPAIDVVLSPTTQMRLLRIERGAR